MTKETAFTMTSANIKYGPGATREIPIGVPVRVVEHVGDDHAPPGGRGRAAGAHLGTDREPVHRLVVEGWEARCRSVSKAVAVAQEHRAARLPKDVLQGFVETRQYVLELGSHDLRRRGRHPPRWVHPLCIRRPRYGQHPATSAPYPFGRGDSVFDFGIPTLASPSISRSVESLGLVPLDLLRIQSGSGCGCVWD